MRFFLIFIFVFLILQAKEIDLNQIDDTKAKLLIYSAKTYTHLKESIDKIRKNDDFIYKYFHDKELYGLYIVNIDKTKLDDIVIMIREVTRAIITNDTL